MCLVSVILPSYNGEKYIKQSIESIIKQTFKDWQLILVDDCSNDKTLEIMNYYSRTDNRITVIHNRMNMNLPNSLNVGFRKAEGELLTWTSDDNVFEINALHEMVKKLVEKDDAYMVVANMYYIDSDGNRLKNAPHYDKELFWYNNNIGACFLYKRIVYETIGEYDANLFGVEDYDYWIRVLKQYSEIITIDKLLYGYRIHDNSLSNKRFFEIKRKLNLLRSRNLGHIVETIRNKSILMALYYDMLLSEKDMTKYIGFFREIELDFYKEYNANNPQILIFGAGEYGRRAHKLFENVIAFVDSDESKIGTIYEGKEVISFSQFVERFPKAQLVVAVDAINLYSISNYLFPYKELNITTIHQVINSMI